VEIKVIIEMGGQRGHDKLQLNLFTQNIIGISALLTDVSGVVRQPFCLTSSPSTPVPIGFLVFSLKFLVVGDPLRFEMLSALKSLLLYYFNKPFRTFPLRSRSGHLNGVLVIWLSPIKLRKRFLYLLVAANTRREDSRRVYLEYCMKAQLWGSTMAGKIVETQEVICSLTARMAVE